MKFTELTKEEFDAFAITHPLCNFWQTSNMAQMREAKGFSTYYVGIKDESGKIIAGSMLSVLPIFMNGTLVQALRGPLLDYKDEEQVTFFHEHLNAFLKKKNCIYLHIDPYVPYVPHDLDGNVVEGDFDNRDVVSLLKKLGYRHEGFTRGIDLSREPRWIYTIPLKGKTPEELMKQFERKTVRSIKKAQKYNVQVHELSRDQIEIYEKVLKQTGERRGFQGRDDEYHHRLYDAFHDVGYVKFLNATIDLDDYKKDLRDDLQKQEAIVETSKKRLEKQESPKIQKKMDLAQEQVNQLKKKLEEANQMIQEDGQVLDLASGIFFTYGKEVLCLMSGVYEKYMRFAAPYAMHWKMMNYCIEHGMDRYNLYGTSGIFDEGAPDYGVYLFKKGFQGEVVELIGDFEYIVDTKKYKIYNTLRKIKHSLQK